MSVKTDTLNIGTRGSDLALWQAHWVQRELTQRFPGLTVTIAVIRTTGDKILDSPLSAIGDKGLFTKEIENALLAGEVDLAVHSLKDLPTILPDGLALGVVCKREDVRDVFIPHRGNPVKTLLDQAPGARIATGSLRRKCQLMALRPDFEIIDVRGNLNTRLKKLDDSDWAGMILARAGIVRLGWEEKIGETIPEETILPAVGQGALGIEVRANDRRVMKYLRDLHHTPTAQAASAERSLLRALEGGCQVPIGTHGRVEQDASGGFTMYLDAMVGSLDGKRIVRGKVHGSPDDAEALGERLAATLIAGGAETILQEIRRLGVPQVEA